MSWTLIALAASIAAADAKSARPSIEAQLNRPFGSRLSSGQSSARYPCLASFDRAVSAIQAGFTADGVNCLHTAARRGSPLALRALGLMRLRGEYLPRDEQEAVALFHQAALRNDAEAMYLLGRSFERGIGVTPDQVLAHFWLQRAAASGYAAPAPTGIQR